MHEAVSRLLGLHEDRLRAGTGGVRQPQAGPAVGAVVAVDDGHLAHLGTGLVRGDGGRHPLGGEVLPVLGYARRVRHWGGGAWRTAPARSRSSTSASVKPHSCSTSLVCWPAAAG